MLDYENLTFKELYQECVDRGILDGNANYIKRQTPEQKKLHENLKIFQEKNKLTPTELIAFLDLADEDANIRKFILKAIEDHKNIRG